MAEICGANRVWVDGGPLTVGALADRGEARIRATLDPTGPLACVADSPLEALELAAAACRADLDVAILGRERVTEAVIRVLGDAGLSPLPDGSAPQGSVACRPGRVWILTSGTTGAPKLIEHTWETLLTVAAGLAPRRWLLPFQPGSYAWFQLVTPALRVSGQELVIAPAGDVRDALRAARTHGADAISSTPTFWRVAFMTVPQPELEALSFRQITLGGEIVDQAILDELGRMFPDARITHIYAATEVGACVVVQDRQAGFPAVVLDPDRRGPKLRIAAGRLLVKPTRRPVNVPVNEDGWIDTGDLVERVGERIYLKGRAGRQMISVGGHKAFPADIEAVLLGHPEVCWCRVEARRAPLVGNLVVARVVALAGSDRAALEQRLAEHCRCRLPEYSVPRLFQFQDEIPLGGNLKSVL